MPHKPKNNSKSNSSKMRCRRELMQILSKYRDDENIAAPRFKEDIDKIKQFEDKSYACKTLFKEITDVKSPYANTCAILALESIEKDIFENEAIKYIEDDKNSDELKFYILSLMKQKGIHVDYNAIFDNIQEPDKLAQNGVRDFLIDAIYDAEVQIDFLDFYLNITKKERLYLLSNMVDEIDGDDLANVLSLLAMLDIEVDEIELVIEGLIKSKSPYALDGLNYILKNVELEKTDESKIKAAIKRINFANRNWKNVSAISDTKIDKCYLGFVDGKANFSLIISRKNPENDKIDMVLFTINVADGINSCMGFSRITQANFDIILKRIYADSMPVLTTAISAKALLNFFYEKNISKNTKLPYEFVVWKKLLNDIRDLNFDVSEFITSKLDSVTLNDAKIKKIMSAKLLETWYFSYGQKEAVDNLIKEIEESRPDDISKINWIVQRAVTKDFIGNEEFVSGLKNMIIIQSYIAKLANLKMSSSYLFSLCFHIKYIKILIESMLDKSIFYYLSTCLGQSEQKKSKKNRSKDIFSKPIKTNFSDDELIKLMEQLEAKWQ